MGAVECEEGKLFKGCMKNSILTNACGPQLGEGEFGFYTLLPAYVRGHAYLAAGNGAVAAGEFQKIIDHRGAVCYTTIGAVAHLYLGRARLLEARSLQEAAAESAKAQARTAYRDFLALWKDADPDLPLLQAAKTEYAKLQ
jgi:hypothetical protein